MCFPMIGGERGFDSDGLSGTSESDADGQLIDEDGDSYTSSDYTVQAGKVLRWRNCTTTVYDRCDVFFTF